MKKLGLLLSLLVVIIISSCEKEEEYVYVDGTYYAETAEYSHGWKALLEVGISKDELVSVDFDYFNEAGDLKSETTVETYPMDPHPSVWLPQYEQELMEADILNFEAVDVVTGATGGGGNLNALVPVVLEAAKDGDTSTQILSAE